VTATYAEYQLGDFVSWLTAARCLLCLLACRRISWPASLWVLASGALCIMWKIVKLTLNWIVTGATDIRSDG